MTTATGWPPESLLDSAWWPTPPTGHYPRRGSCTRATVARRSRCWLPGPGPVWIVVATTPGLVRTWSMRTKGGRRKNRCDHVMSSARPRAAAASVSPVPRIARNPRFPHVALKSPTINRGRGPFAPPGAGGRRRAPGTTPARLGPSERSYAPPTAEGPPPRSVIVVRRRYVSPSTLETETRPSGYRPAIRNPLEP